MKSGAKRIGNSVKRNSGKLCATAFVASSVAVAGATGATLDASAATAGVTTAIGFGTEVIVSGLGIGVLFMIGRVIRRGMRSAG